MSSAVEILHSIGERFQTDGSVQKVFGDPIVVEGKTVVPVARVSYGFGAGGGSREERAGGGGGGGLRVEPAGVLEITATETRFIHFLDPRRIAQMVAVGFALGMMFSAMRRRRKR
jgi:uncharacterized spore protein YtfJ